MADPPPPAAGGAAGPPWRYRMRVRYGECDAQGVVFNANYLLYLDQGITELWRELFGGYAQMTARGVDIMLAESRLRFRGSGRFDEEIDIHMEVAALGTTSMTLRERITRATDDAVLIEAEMRYVWVQTTDHVKTAIPDWARARLTPPGQAAVPG